jgi:hypothetical protein
MASQGLPVTVIMAPLDQDDRELKLLSAVGRGSEGDSEHGRRDATGRENRTAVHQRKTAGIQTKHTLDQVNICLIYVVQA